METAEDIEMDGAVAYDVAPPMMMSAPPPEPASRVVIQAQQEELGDLKLYRIPEPVTVAANSQKQVALLQRAGVHVRTLYRMRFYGNPRGYGGPAQRLLVTRNRPQEGLGLPLPAGRLMLFDSRAGNPFLSARRGSDQRSAKTSRSRWPRRRRRASRRRSP